MAEQSCFENFDIEDVSLCPQEEVQAGITEEIQYMPSDHVDEEATESEATDFEGSVSLTGDIVPITGKGFKKLKMQVDLNGLKSVLVGNKGNKKVQVTLEAFLPGMRPKLVGFQKLMKNVGVILIVKDLNGNKWQIGTKDIPARFENIDIDTGKTLEDNNGATLNIVCNTYPRLYTGNIPAVPVVPPTGG